jgi:hypothetical protein
VIAGEDVYFHLRHFIDAQRFVAIEIALHGAASLDLDLTVVQSTERKADAARMIEEDRLSAPTP